MRITVELRRPRRRSLVLLIGAVLLGVPAAAWANHQFPDVPTGHTFHTEIGAIAEAGVTAGFMDGGYHPSDPVTRQAMAAFMHRGFGRVGLVTGTATNAANVSVIAGQGISTFSVVRQITITVPGAANTFSPTQMVFLHGRVAFTTIMSTGQGCPCDFAAVVRDVTGNTLSPAAWEMFYGPTTTQHLYVMDIDALFPASPGSRTYNLEVYLAFRESNTNPATFALDSTSSLSAMTFPFGPTGADTP